MCHQPCRDVSDDGFPFVVGCLLVFVAGRAPDGSLALLWNSVTPGHGRRHRPGAIFVGLLPGFRSLTRAGPAIGRDGSPGSPVATFPVPVGVTATHPGVSTPIRVNRDTRRNTSKPARHLDTKYCSMPRQLSLGLPWHTRVYDWNPWHLDMLGCCEPTRSCLQSVTSSCGKRRILLFVCKLYGLGISI